MTAAITGLVGVLLGAIMAQFGAIMSDRRQARIEAARWQRDQAITAYNEAIRYLSRALTLGNQQDRDLGNWFHDVIEAQASLQALSCKCGEGQIDGILEARRQLEELRAHVGFAVAGTTATPSELSVLSGALKVVTECAREDVARATSGYIRPGPRLAIR